MTVAQRLAAHAAAVTALDVVALRGLPSPQVLRPVPEYRRDRCRCRCPAGVAVLAHRPAVGVLQGGQAGGGGGRGGGRSRPPAAAAAADAAQRADAAAGGAGACLRVLLVQHRRAPPRSPASSRQPHPQPQRPQEGGKRSDSPRGCLTSR